jgi:hypothetical protein
MAYGAPAAGVPGGRLTIDRAHDACAREQQDGENESNDMSIGDGHLHVLLTLYWALYCASQFHLTGNTRPPNRLAYPLHESHHHVAFARDRLDRRPDRGPAVRASVRLGHAGDRPQVPGYFGFRRNCCGNTALAGPLMRYASLHSLHRHAAGRRGVHGCPHQRTGQPDRGAGIAPRGISPDRTPQLSPARTRVRRARLPRICLYASAFLLGVGLGLAWLNFGAESLLAAEPAQDRPSNAPLHALRGPVPV